MKRGILILLGVFFIMGRFLSAQNIPDNITNTFKTGNAKLITAHLSEKVTYIYGGTQQSVSKSDFVVLLGKFLETNKPQSFKILHQSSQQGSGFMIGRLTAVSGNSFRVHCLFKIDNNLYLINQLRIDTFNE